MPIETPHPQYSDNIDRWTRCRDCYDGEDAVKSKGETYLPKIDPSQTSTEYNAYKTRASYYEAVSRTVDGFVGAISRKPHVIEMPAKLEPLEGDATSDGTSLADFVKKLAQETLLQGRGGVLVDYDEGAQRPYLTCYQAEAIISWTADGVVLSETVYEADPADARKRVAVEQLRECALEDGRYVVNIWRKRQVDGVAAEWAISEVIVPTMRGRPLAEVPWFWLTTMGRSARIEKPPMLGLVNLSLSHYRSSADLEHGRHFTALPTLYITGHADGDRIAVGGGAVIALADPQAKVGYAEFTGAGLGSLENAIEAKEHQMATLGAAIWGGKKGIEAAETARIRTAGENSLLMGIVAAIEDVLTAALQFARDWMGVSGDVKVRINRDFVDQRLDAQTLVGMVQAYQAGAMTLEAFLYALQQADMLPPETEIDEEAAKIRAADAAKKAAAAKVAPQVTTEGQPVAD